MANKKGRSEDRPLICQIERMLKLAEASSYIMPPMPPMPPMSGIAGPEPSFFGASAIMASVVTRQTGD